MKAFAILGKFVSVLALLVFSSIFNGYALSILWGWFMVPVFHLPQLSLVPAIGISMVVGYLTQQSPEAKKKNDEVSTGMIILNGVLWAVFKPSFALLFGSIVHSFM